ncbi:MAG: hypothetical protein JWO89_1676 [Verrucomicrobiaceae bacterium]|nr:hypothetical protein [Verrucomicrobiaceae bacterium]
MKTTIQSNAASDLGSVLVRPLSNALSFGTGYLRYLSAAASMDEDEPANSKPAMHQPVRYLGAVEPMVDGRLARWETVGNAARVSAQAASLREAVISLRNKILAS